MEESFFPFHSRSMRHRTTCYASRRYIFYATYVFCFHFFPSAGRLATFFLNISGVTRSFCCVCSATCNAIKSLGKAEFAIAVMMMKFSMKNKRTTISFLIFAVTFPSRSSYHQNLHKSSFTNSKTQDHVLITQVASLSCGKSLEGTFSHHSPLHPLSEF